MRKTVCIGILSVALVAAGPFLFGRAGHQETGTYADAHKILEKLASALELFIEDMAKAESPKAVSKGLDVLTGSMSELVPGLNEIRQKYPELKDEATHPQELKPLLERVDKDFMGMMKAYAKVRENLSDASVKASDDKYKEVMAQLK